MDIGHGTGSFAYETAEALMAAGRTPDVISTDLHQLSINGPAYDLPTVMSKFLHLGMPLREVVRATTSRPAEILGLDAEVGTLRPGSLADVALFRLLPGRFPLLRHLGRDAGGGRAAREHAHDRRRHGRSSRCPPQAPGAVGARSRSGRSSRRSSPSGCRRCATAGTRPRRMRAAAEADA